MTCNIDVGSALARAWNEWQTEEWLDKDGRYLGSICVNMNDPVEAAREIRRAKAAHKNMVQVVVCGESSDLYGHRRYYPIYEACEEVGHSVLYPSRHRRHAHPVHAGRLPVQLF